MIRWAQIFKEISWKMKHVQERTREFIVVPMGRICGEPSDRCCFITTNFVRYLELSYEWQTKELL